MKKTILILTCVLLSFSAIFGQSNKLDKKMEKAYSLAEKGKLDDAEKYVEDLLEENPDYGSGWDYLSKIRYKQYQNSKSLDNLFGGNVVVTTKDKDGNEVKSENDSLGKNLMEMLNKIKPSQTAYDKYVYTMRRAILTSNDAYYCSQMLRNNFIDEECDTAVSKKALKYFNDAEDEFEKKNYYEASKLYKRAIDAQPDFYKAALYMGDCFYFQKNYTDAITSFKQAVEKFPNALEPRKYLIDAYIKDHLYDKALEEAIMAMTVYPDQVIAFVKLEDALYLNEKTQNIKWTPRAVFPNKILSENAGSELNKYTPKKELPENEPWSFYKKSLSAISDYCNEKGIIVKPNDFTQTKYLEIYGWEEMLNNSNDPLLDEARRMQKDGYLDCYVLVTCFHFDIYDQYSDFVSENRSRVIEYYNKYTVNKK